MVGSPIGGSPLAFDPIQESHEVSEGGKSEDPSYEPEGEDGSPTVSPPPSMLNRRLSGSAGQGERRVHPI